MHWYVCFCVFYWVMNSAVGSNRKRKRWISPFMRLQTQKEEPFVYNDRLYYKTIITSLQLTYKFYKILRSTINT